MSEQNDAAAWTAETDKARLLLNAAGLPIGLHLELRAGPGAAAGSGALQELGVSVRREVEGRPAVQEFLRLARSLGARRDRLAACRAEIRQLEAAAGLADETSREAADRIPARREEEKALVAALPPVERKTWAGRSAVVNALSNALVHEATAARARLTARKEELLRALLDAAGERLAELFALQVDLENLENARPLLRQLEEDLLGDLPEAGPLVAVAGAVAGGEAVA